MRVLASVSNREGLAELAHELSRDGHDIVSTGGTAAHLRAAGIETIDVAAITGFPEILDGRVKTLHPKVHGGILARRDLPDHLRQLGEHAIAPIDLVISNLYPFGETLAKTSDDGAIIEQIDVGGPAIARAAAKNFAGVIVLVDPADYPEALDRIRSGRDDLSWRRLLAAKAFRHVAAYDAMVAAYLTGGLDFPETMSVPLLKAQSLRYGENPHQSAALYVTLPIPPRGATLATGEQLHGPDLSFNNMLDMDGAFACVRDFAAPTAVIVKHGNPCGLASADTIGVAFDRALAGDPVSAFGGAIAVNRPVDRDLARAIASAVYHDLAAPAFTDEALTILRMRKNLRVFRVDLETNRSASRFALNLKRIDGGFLAQTLDARSEDDVAMTVVSARPPTDAERGDLRFAWRAVKHVRSNAIVLARDRSLVGIGAGQMSRVDSSEIAVRKAGPRSAGAVMASDGLIPFADGAEVVAAGGVTAIIQPGGSVRDREVIEVVNAHGMAMVFTGVRHFRH
ncbi:MAG: bifunctional phosphoribosylaminoimidazolecarboxamide formyltransferase/IMP cyclohydrolase [Chloroflexota bacterium]|nr:MAG: bifunctional phosphoribosylaminoimidazolecarboxamide formyltransferase/IMP cyclohydrolase [Chloroflexota bacterium]